LGTDISWSLVVVVVGILAGIAAIIFGLRKKDGPAKSFEDVGGILKSDWARTGNIDFHISTPGSASPQQLVLRVEEKKVVENAMGEDVVQLRWRLATIEEAKELVVCWKAHTSPGP
jgi:hypothetical protein